MFDDVVQYLKKSPTSAFSVGPGTSIDVILTYVSSHDKMPGATAGSTSAFGVELQTKVCEYFTITEKVPILGTSPGLVSKDS